jgi:hypothetical protein
VTATLEAVLPWTVYLDAEQRAEFLRDIALATTDPAVEQREQLLADDLATYERDAHDQADRDEQYQLYREATRA